MKKYWYIFVGIFVCLISGVIYFNSLSNTEKIMLEQKIKGNKITYNIDYTFAAPYTDAKPKIELEIVHEIGNNDCKNDESKMDYFDLLKLIAEENNIQDYYFSINCKHYDHLFGVSEDGVIEVLTPQY